MELRAHQKTENARTAMETWGEGSWTLGTSRERLGMIQRRVSFSFMAERPDLLALRSQKADMPHTDFSHAL